MDKSGFLSNSKVSAPTMEE